MGADASIFQTQPVRSASDYMGDMDLRDLRRMQLQGATQNNALHALTMDQTRQTMADTQRKQNALRAAVQAVGPNADPTKFASVLLQNPDTMDAGVALQKHLADLAETQAKTQRSAGLTPDQVATTAKTVGETADASLKRYRGALDFVDTPAGAARWLQAQYQDPALASHMQALGPMEAAVQRIPSDPQGFQQWRQQAGMGMDAYQKHLQERDKITETGRHNKADEVISVSNNANTVRASMANAGALRDQAAATRDAATIQTGFANETSLRKEFEGLPEVKNYKQAYPAYAAIKDATTRNTTQSDINIVYGLAKLYDPTSVVREGEYATVANSPNIPERIKGYAQYLAGGGKLSPETKKQIVAEAEGRIGTYKAEHDKARGSYEGIAKSRGMKPEAVFQAMGDAPTGGAAAGGGNLSAAEADELKKLRAMLTKGK